MTKKQQRLAFVLGGLAVLAIAATLTLTALRSAVTYFYLPADVAELSETPEGLIRLGGLVGVDSVQYSKNEKADTVSFTVVDTKNSITVEYAGLLPDLFREGQGVVVTGRLADKETLIATNVLAKHDENYVPKDLEDALKEQGVWRDGEGEKQ